MEVLPILLCGVHFSHGLPSHFDSLLIEEGRVALYVLPELPVSGRLVYGLTLVYLVLLIPVDFIHVLRHLAPFPVVGISIEVEANL